MKLKAGQVEGFLRSPDDARAILIFGPDDGLVRERAKRLAGHVVDDLNDPFRVVELSTGHLKDDPARLSDEALAVSFGGGRRVVWVRGAQDACEPACKSYLDSDVLGDAMVLVEAGDLNPRSKLRKLFESAKQAVALPCYGDDARTLPDVIRQTLGEHGLVADRDAMALLVHSLGSDRSVTRGELHKLALYMGEETQVTADHVRACVGDSGASALDDVIHAAAGGDPARLETALMRVFAEGTNAVQIVRAAQRHFHRLHMARGHMAQGMNPDQAVKALRPPVMWKVADAFKRQLVLWPEANLARAFDILTRAETDCKTTGLPADAVTGRALLSLAQAARATQGRAAR